MRHIISILMENEAGALSRVAGLFSARAYNIESLTVAPTEDDSLSRMTIVTSGNEEIIEQILKQLNKLIDTVKVMDLSDNGPIIEREYMLIKVKAEGIMREETKRLSDILRANIIDLSSSTYIIEMAGTEDKLNAFIDSIGNEHIIEVVRSGALGIARGPKGIM